MTFYDQTCLLGVEWKCEVNSRCNSVKWSTWLVYIQSIIQTCTKFQFWAWNTLIEQHLNLFLTAVFNSFNLFAFSVCDQRADATSQSLQSSKLVRTKSDCRTLRRRSNSGINRHLLIFKSKYFKYPKTNGPHCPKFDNIFK